MKDLQLSFISNQTTKRLFRILSVIERERLFTFSKMAEEMEVTQRTIANDIKYIKNYFGECISLTSGNSGCFFQEKKPYLYQKRKQKLLESECLFAIIGDIFRGELSRIDELAHKYHLSESTFRRLMNQVTPILNSYELCWTSNPLAISGSEANLRKFFKDFYYEGVETVYTIVPDPELHELLLNQLSHKLAKCDIGSGTTPASFYYTLYIAIKRASLGFSISVPQYLIDLAYKAETFWLLSSLKNSIEEYYNVGLSEAEFAWVYLVTVCKRSVTQEEAEKNFYKQFCQGTEIADLTNEYLEILELPDGSQSIIKTFLRSFFLSRKVSHLLAPVLNKEANDVKEALIRSNKENYQTNLQFLRKNQKLDFLSTPYLEDICVSLTIYSGLILEFYTPVKRICFLLEGDHFVCQKIRIRATQQFGNRHSLIFLPIHHLTKEFLKANNIDLIVTNYNRYLLDFIIETDYLLLKPVPDKHDWRHLEKKIDPYRKSFY